MQKLSTLGLTPTCLGFSFPLPLVTLEEFFCGNTDQESFAVNLLSPDPALNSHPGLSNFFETMKTIRSRKDVASVMVEVVDIEPAVRFEDSWPYSEKLFISTSAPSAEVENWASILRASGAVSEYDSRWHVNPIPERPGFRTWYLIWD
jgi:hypothetical protein